MPYSKEHKQKSRENILESAAKLFIARGFDNTSIDEIMGNANMTRGAFYAHFANKSELYAQAMLYAATNSLFVTPKPEHLTEKALVEKILRGYLSLTHFEQEMPCPAAFLVTDVVNKDPLVRKTYTKIYKGMNKHLAHHAKSFSSCHADTILAITAMMIGGVAVGRALDDQTTAQKLLNSCHKVAQTLLNTE
ncbi:TetR/AcrR family transcriptional regulator [Kaarinaea lacus]